MGWWHCSHPEPDGAPLAADAQRGQSCLYSPAEKGEPTGNGHWDAAMAVLGVSSQYTNIAASTHQWQRLSYNPLPG